MDDEKKTPPGGVQVGGTQPRADAISSLWQSALGQIDEIRDVIVRGSQAGKAKLDVQLLKRQRDKLLMQIGEAVIHEGHVPASCEELAARVVDVDKQIADADAEAQKVFKRG
ncbi:MAG TPA: hypothetical protein VGO62_16870 [Myxococcota bacterium]